MISAWTLPVSCQQWNRKCSLLTVTPPSCLATACSTTYTDFMRYGVQCLEWNIIYCALAVTHLFTQCNSTDALRQFLHKVKSGDHVMLGMIGCGCSVATDEVAKISSFWNIPLVRNKKHENSNKQLSSKKCQVQINFSRSPMLAHQQCSVIEECIVIITGPSPQMSCYHHCSQPQWNIMSGNS